MREVDRLILFGYVAAVTALGLWLSRRSRRPEAFMTADRSLPGWAVGLSMFGSYVSSISFLANPGKSYAGNWNAFVFTLATPFAAAAAVRWFVPFYRRSGDVSAYDHLERRFGGWARTYAVVCFQLTQMARMGAVLYLLGLVVAKVTGWSVAGTIVAAGALMTVYTIAGGINAAVWVGALQSVVLVAGTAACLIALLTKAPGGVAGVIETGVAHDKFGLGSFGTSLAEPTFWVVFVFGLTTHLSNFAVDQSYVQRYISARDDRAAANSIWITAGLYMPVAAVFFFVGTALFAFYSANPALLPQGIKADKVFPEFISTQLPPGMAGLVVAAIFAASMDSNLNSMATLTLCDLYQRYLRPAPSERESMLVLRGSTLLWGVLGTGVGLLMIRVETALDAWWQLAGLFSGGMLGLFLLGQVSRSAGNAAGMIGVTLGVLVSVWMTLSQLEELPEGLRSGLHTNLTIVAATLAIFLGGLIASRVLVRGSR